MGLMPICQNPDTGQAAKGHKIYPHPLRGLRVDRPNHVLCADITCLPMRRGVLYLVAIMDRRIRKVLSRPISNTLEAGFCMAAPNEAIHKFGPPEIVNIVHGREVTSLAWTGPCAPNRCAHFNGWKGPVPG